MRLDELKGQGWQLALCRPCLTCSGRGSVLRASFANASLHGGFYGSSVQAEPPCPMCLNGFTFAPIPAEDALAMLFEGLIKYLEDPKNSALRKRYIDLHITDVEQRMMGQIR